MNIKMNWVIAHLEFKEDPIKIGNQYVIPAPIANTAPIDKTIMKVSYNIVCVM